MSYSPVGTIVSGDQPLRARSYFTSLGAFDNGSDDGYKAIPNVGFYLPFYGTLYDGSTNVISVSANSNLQFGFQSTAYGGFSATWGKSIQLGADDRSVDFAGYSAESWLCGILNLHFEGGTAYNNPTSDTHCWEVLMFEDGTIEIRIGLNFDTTMGTNMITNGSSVGASDFSGFGTGTSFVLEPTFNFTGYNVYFDSYYDVGQYSTGSNNYQKTLTDNLTLSEVTVQRLIGRKLTTESLTLSDNINVVPSSGAQHYTKSLTDSITLSEILSRKMGKALSDSITLSETLTKRISVFKSLTDTLTLSETVSKQLSRKLSDTISLVESFSKNATYGKVLSDTLSFLDNAVAQFVVVNNPQITLLGIQDIRTSLFVSQGLQQSLNGLQDLLIRLNSVQELRVVANGLMDLVVKLGGAYVGAINQNFTMYQGDSKQIVVTVKKDDTTLLNLTGSTVVWSFDTLTKSIGSGVALTDPTNGVFTVTINPADTSTRLGNYTHSAKVTDAGGNVSTVLVGTITVTKPS